MKIPGKHPEETRRLAALQALQILDTPAEDGLDGLTRLAQELFDVPIALISLVDDKRQWFKSCHGLDIRETHRDVSFCGHAVANDAPFVIEDTASDPAFVDHPWSPAPRISASTPVTRYALRMPCRSALCV